MTRDRLQYLLLVVTVFTYLVLRAVLVPLVHDESASILWYVFPGEWLPWRAHADANNHFLSSAIGLLSGRCFGVHVWSLRAGSMLAFVCYAWGCWRVGTFISMRYVRWCLWVAMIGCPFLLDFFSLFRGYGIELAGWVFALDGMLRYARSGSAAHVAQCVLGYLIGTASIIALVPPSGIMLGLLMWITLRRGMQDRTRETFARWSILLFGVAALAYSAHVAMGMKEAGLLYYGSTNGFIPVTVGSLARYVLGTHAWWVLALIVIATVWAAIVHVGGATWRGPHIDAGSMLLVLLLGDVFARVVLAHVSGVNFPEDRAGLHFVPLFLLVLAFAIDKAARSVPRLRWSATVFLVLPLRSVVTANVDHTLIWAEQSIPERWGAIARAEEQALGRPLVIGGYHQLALSWPISAQLRGERVPLICADGFPSGAHDLRIVDSRFIDRARDGYQVIDHADGPGLWLLRRTPPMVVAPLDTVHVPMHQGNDEFVELAHLPEGALRAGPVRVDVRTTLTLNGVPPDAALVFEVNDSAGAKLIYDRVPVLAARARWSGEAFTFARTLPTLPGAVRAVVYVHDPTHCAMAVGAGEVIVGLVR